MTNEDKIDWIFEALKYLITISDTDKQFDMSMWKKSLLEKNFQIEHPESKPTLKEKTEDALGEREN